jgi:hypothetical protein
VRCTPARQRLPLDFRRKAFCILAAAAAAAGLVGCRIAGGRAVYADGIDEQGTKPALIALWFHPHRELFMQEFAVQSAQSVAAPLPPFRAALAGAVLLGVCLALGSIVLLSLLEPLLRERTMRLAAAPLLRQSNWSSLLLMGVLWAPLFGTVIGQTIPIFFVRRFSNSTLAGMLSGAAAFGVGQLLAGAGWEQGILGVICGAVFSWRYVHGLEYGVEGATALTAVVHASNNALLLCVSALA